MTSSILLTGNLGQRHQYLNSLVREVSNGKAPFQDFQSLPEHSAIDRLFKIDLASKLHNVDYIIQSLKDDDMLYVSRALKSKWLLDHKDIINTKYLEGVLYPEMIKPAVSRMKHWLYVNLRDPTTCQEFYQYYKENAFEFAIKFLGHCGDEFIINEVPKILSKISTHHLKILSETCPKVAKIYFDLLATDEDDKIRYLDSDQSYYNSVKCVLKSDADVFLDITEKYFNINSFSRLSPTSTDYILRFHKNRFSNKVELYTAYILHVPTLANQLSVKECQEVVIKLARAKYLGNLFQYKAVEPLVKRLSPDKRAAFKKRVFVDKDIGECVEEWPYYIPTPPTHFDPGAHVFDDQDFTPIYEVTKKFCKRRMMKRKCERYQSDYIIQSCEMAMKSELDKLFNEFRFMGFDRTLHDIGQRLGAAGSADRRRDMFLVLVSKSGGRSDAVSALLRLAARHTNEPAHTRASVLRSLVKRANVWRLPEDVWQKLLVFGHGLGLDGTASEAACREGLHAVVIRQLLDGECDPAVRSAFLADFSTLAEYSLSSDERQRVASSLQKILTSAAKEVEPEIAVERLGQLLDVLDNHHISIQLSSSTMEAVVALASRDAEVAQPLLERLYNARVARRDLLRINLKFRRDQAALMNALRHDLLALESKQIVEVLTDGSNYDSFVSKLTIYFQQEDLVTQLLTDLKEKATKSENMKLARPLASLLGNDLKSEIEELDTKGPAQARLAAALRASAHRARPAVNAAEWGWRAAGVKAVSTRAMRCREVERAELTRALAAHRRTVRVALALSMRSEAGNPVETFALAAKLRPVALIRPALLYFRLYGSQADLAVWDIVKPLILNVDLSSRKYLSQILGRTDWIPRTVKPDYCATLYIAFNKTSYSSAKTILLDLSKLLPEVSDESLVKVLFQNLESTDKDTVENIPYPPIFVRYLMLSKTVEDLDRRFQKIGKLFLDNLDTLRRQNHPNIQEVLDQMMDSLMYNAAFFDTKFPSCLLVIERVIAWMQNFMPKEQYFKNYAQIHLTMLYYKAVRQSMKQMPEVFGDPKRKLAEGVEAVGFVFGRYVAREVAELVSTYFDSMVELYTDVLGDYLNHNFMYGSSRAVFIGAVLKGLLAESVGNQRRLAVYVLGERRYDVEDSVRKEIEELTLKDKATEMFAHAELFT